MTDKLTNENLPEEIRSREQFLKEFIEEYEIDTRKFRGKTHLVCWKINLQGVPPEEHAGYIEAVQNNLGPDMKKLSIADFYIPTFDEPTQMVIVDLRTMKYVRV